MTINEQYEADQTSARADLLTFAQDIADGATPPPQRTVKAVADAAGVNGNAMKALRAIAEALQPIRNNPQARKALRWK